MIAASAPGNRKKHSAFAIFLARLPARLLLRLFSAALEPQRNVGLLPFPWKSKIGEVFSPSAVKKARELAGEKNIGLHGASSVQQALKAGLLEEFHVNIAHVLLGEGVRLFDHLDVEPIHLERIRVLETPGATHLSFRVISAHK